ncbi:MAG: glycosyl transferase family 1 [Legionellales bacterium]|nr:MAG: glycosyl transferase family 1 [Legionellales bacterium]
MNILKVIHGYPPRYNAGSEVYSRTLCRGLIEKGHKVTVFSRFENPFLPDYHEEHDKDGDIDLWLINLPLEKHRCNISDEQVDLCFKKLLGKVKPDLVHIGHLNHLSSSLVKIIKEQKIPIVYTLHDYWLMCPRGQFIQRKQSADMNIWPLCSGQEDAKCAKNCYAGYFTGVAASEDVQYWQKWIHNRMQYIKHIATLIDAYIAPSQYLLNRFKNYFAIPSSKLYYLDYGFNVDILHGRMRSKDEPWTFGYIGTHIPSKGIQLLIKAFSNLQNSDCILKIWGKFNTQNTPGLQQLIKELPLMIQERIEWCGEYQNDSIVRDVFNKIDCLVVPSIWVENSPLVIHEALQVRLPIITADIGGMAEYVQHEVNGLLFKHRDYADLYKQMHKTYMQQEWINSIAIRGYLGSKDGNVVNIPEHILAVENIYKMFV